jgi:hypothetical protein
LSSNRPFYESSDDRQRERSMAAAIALNLGLDWAKNKPSFELDFSFFDPRDQKICLFMEYKRRRVSFQTYPSIKIAANKLIAAKRYRAALKIDCVLVVEYDNTVQWLNLDAQPDAVVLWGRTDRNDPQDIEPAVELENYRFRPLEKLKTWWKGEPW